MSAFPADTITFLSDLRQHNDKAWFDANRTRYESAYVAPAKAFVEAAGPWLDAIVPGIRAEPKVLGSIFRINRDTRFSADKRPYKDHLDFWFWQGERKAAVSGLFLRVSPDSVMVGAGAHAFTNEQLGRYRDAVVDPPTAADLAATVTRLEDAGHEVEGSTYTRTPRGYAGTGTSERFLRHSALYVHRHLPAGAAVTDGLLDDLLGTWRTMAPLHTWLVANVQQR